MPTLSAPLWQYLAVFLARGGWRISERTLFVFALLGGAVGGTIGMFVFHHKTRHLAFRLCFPLLAAAQLALCGYLLFQ